MILDSPWVNLNETEMNLDSYYIGSKFIMVYNRSADSVIKLPGFNPSSILNPSVTLGKLLNQSVLHTAPL